MSRLFNQLAGFPRTLASREREVLCAMPRLLWLGSLILCLPALLVRLWLALEPDMEPGRMFTTDIYVASLVILYWTVLLTAGIAAFIVMVMKGPAYVADAYPLDEDDTEARPSR